ncbi:MAG: ergothioneine biosynthesis protein EgtB [Balneolaceae bacterium]|nr:MAG: ergothioneine biosynthesis protein EgtB [Balneolaceae bacterium]
MSSLNISEKVVINSLNDEKELLVQRFKKIRDFTEMLTEPLETEDFVIQAVEETSPVKWHLAHTSWFFEAFVLKKGMEDYESLHPQYDYIFNSYYVQTSDPHCRDQRGNLSRPTVKQVFEFRKFINRKMYAFIESLSESEFETWKPVIEIGLHHEQQHQELLLTDLKFLFAQNPLYPIYKERSRPFGREQQKLNWIQFEEGVYQAGHEGGEFGYDNEFPNHKTYIHPFNIADRLVTNGEYLAFMNDGGYSNTKWWLDEGFSTVEREEWASPLYWVIRDDEWHHYTLNGIEKLDLHEPVTHVSYYEADAYARWAGARLATEQEWEVASKSLELEGPFVESGNYHPSSADPDTDGLKQMFGDVWQWTQCSYSPYPGYKPFPGALGEYNGKFMVNQYVLRGGSCATSKTHIRRTYRNFFHAHSRWQFSGIRLAQDAVQA